MARDDGRRLDVIARAGDVSDRKASGASGDREMPAEIAPTPRLRRLAALWIDELRRQWSVEEGAEP